MKPSPPVEGELGWLGRETGGKEGAGGGAWPQTALLPHSPSALGAEPGHRGDTGRMVAAQGVSFWDS